MRQAGRTWQLVAAALAAVIACAAPAAAQPAGAEAPYLDPIWPERLAGGDARGVIVPLEGVPSEWRERLLRHGRPGADPDDWRDIEAALPEPERQGADLEGPNALIFVRRAEEGRPEPGAEVFKYVSAREGPKGPLIERTWFGVYQPREGRRGVVLLLPGMFGTPRPVVDAAVEQLRSAGWGVVRMMSHPSRFTERFVVVADPADGVEDDAAVIARELGERVAEAAYASRAAMDEAVRRFPWMGEGPLVALGMSGGAMILSTVVALEPERYDAAVAIAGGADYLEILRKSNYSDWIGAVDVSLVAGATPADARALREAYLARAPLDSYHTARFLRDIPTLMIHGTRDLAVPAHTGDLLWERAGQPERWTRAMGHEMLFLRLAMRVGDVIDWINTATGEAPADQDGK
ncbi:MAG: alpha/beta hydrolase [Phycisphaerales bacterium JB039]